MRKKLLTGKALLLCLLYFTTVHAAPVPANLYGHWLRTDGSNRFVIGIYANTVCYENETWRISSAKEVQGRWQLRLEHGSKTALVTLQRKDSTTLLLGDGRQQELKNIRTFNYSYHPEQPSFCQPLFTEGSALLKGLVQWKGKRREKENYVQLSYNDMRTGNVEYLFADLDSLNSFSLRIPLHMPVFCSISIGSLEVNNFLVQPGDTLLLAFNTTISLDDANPDYNKLTQRVSFMGSGAAFNNQYQHYVKYASHLNIQPVKSSSSSDRDMPVLVKKQQQFNQYSKLYDSILNRIDLVYPAYVAEQRVIDFIKAEARYRCVLAILEDRDTDSSYLQKMYEQYLAGETPLALMHGNFYKLAGIYADRLHHSRFGNWRSYSVPFDKMAERVQKDYGQLLSQGFMEKYNEIQKDRNSIDRMKDSVVIEKYFNGNREEAQNFRYIFKKITNEFRKEALDSTAYRLYERTIPNACLRFAANLKQLQGNSWDDDEIPMPSLYRIAIFKHYSQLPEMPDQQVASVNTAQALTLAAASIELKLDTQRIRQIDHESEWQTALKAYRGKTVVIWTFNHFFRKEYATRAMYELKKMQARYRGKNVVFLKCIQQRHRSDRTKILLQYLDIFNAHGQLNDLFYIERKMSVGAIMEESINDCCAIYNTSGQAHHPSHYTRKREKRDYDNFTLAGELDSVLAGKGHYYEGKADNYLQADDRMGYTILGTGKTWTLYDSTGRYYLYRSDEPEKPVYELNYDSVYHLLSFMKDSIWLESKLVFHEEPPSKSRERQFFSLPRYSREHKFTSPFRIYKYDRHKKILNVYDDKKKLYRAFRVVFINPECLVLELMP
ncbi:hypothetical protein FAM09_16950 [Niastella caeni]|uniref:Uncharacterized protein n=1 Tax=Niastella caeni TaxID=2569763 RepID=A0A4S8HYP4_9BACT|nr:hypothetical protein [Niastella caeni]THU38362.1 hypothetical protein FAM09_16950 [Niastella caeni]